MTVGNTFRLQAERLTQRQLENLLGPGGEGGVSAADQASRPGPGRFTIQRSGTECCLDLFPDGRQVNADRLQGVSVQIFRATVGCSKWSALLGQC